MFLFCWACHACFYSGMHVMHIYSLLGMSCMFLLWKVCAYSGRYVMHVSTLVGVLMHVSPPVGMSCMFLLG
jgi:hypothetical protein